MKRLALIVAALLCSLQAAAQSWPAKPVRIVVPLGAGGFADVPARILAPQLGAQLNGAFVVENRPGAGSTIGADFVAKSEPDGYTWLFTATPHVISAWLYKSLKYDSLASFAPVARVAAGPYVLVVHPDLGASSVAELIAAAKAAPGKIDYASSGNGSAQHLVTALFADAAGIELNHVPYKGSGQAMQDVLGGRVKVHFAGVPNVINHVRAGKLKALGVTTTQRWPDLPEVPAIAEAGVAGFEATLWLCMLAPAGTPDAIVQRVSAALDKAMQDPEVLKQLRVAGISPSYLGPQAFGAFMRSEHERWGRVVKQTGATIN
ncbi:MAG: tripartite tricarboxylate transporter substrate binding protein [Betaproteobacteria bacterium]|nr:tripartite tricarboxylate transporter substrate binding protein [Betaproteobacteria bacterium]MDH5220934.1 tripartite tricarboxylate transporter substrate binding protein [Betaproteobacteria bacterium]MDH5351947.1 tripartite tricarboxylate transporter substrate binding protein [Betaproteobacteria bacterium]